MAADHTDKLDLRRLAKERLLDAKALLKEKRLDGARYVCGYAVEHILKYKICKTLKWTTYPPDFSTERGRQVGRAIKTHELETLLMFTGEYDKIYSTSALLAAWNDIKWDSEIRYQYGQVSKTEVQRMIASTTILMSHFGSTV